MGGVGGLCDADINTLTPAGDLWNLGWRCWQRGISSVLLAAHVGSWGVNPIENDSTNKFFFLHFFDFLKGCIMLYQLAKNQHFGWYLLPVVPAEVSKIGNL